MKIICLTGFPGRETKKKWGRIMRLTLFLMVGFLLSASANSYSQNTRLNIKLKDGTVTELMKSVEDNSEFVFLYKNEDLDLKKKVNVELENATIQQVLDAGFAGQQVGWDVYDRQIVIHKADKLSLPPQQQRTVTGVVTDQNGLPLPGVTVVVTGTTTGTVTNADGNFSLALPDGVETLQFSFVGMRTKEIPIEGRTTFTVVMEEETIGLEEVVAIGYGTRIKEELTGAVSTVSGDKLNLSSSPTAIGRLQGQVSGVTVSSSNVPGGEAIIRVRGLGTINDNNPLYVIDGVPSDPGNNLNPNDIESISILKDASSTAIYGARGANGVVIITTNRGREGQKPTIRFHTRTGISQASNKYDLLNTQEYSELQWLYAKMLGYTPGVDWQHAQYGNGTSPRIPDFIMPAGAMEGDPGTDPSLYNYPNYMIVKANKEGTDWYDEIYQNGIVQEFGINVTGGTNKTSYAVSSAYLNEEGFLIHTGFERYSFMANNDININKWLKIGQSLQTSYTNQFGNLTNNEVESPLAYAFRPQPILPVYDIMGNFAGSIVPTMGNSRNAVAELERYKDDLNSNLRLLGNFYGEIKLYEGLTIKSLLGYNYGHIWSETRRIPDPEHAEPRPIAESHRNTNKIFQWNWTNTISYSYSLSDNQKLNIILGTEAVAYTHKWLGASRSQYFSTDPRYMQIDAGEADIRNSGSAEEWSLFSLFGRLNYDIMSRYFIELTLRRDGSSRFGEENRYGNFPAGSFAWVISEERFMEGTTNWLDYLKLRIGWGLSGNDRIGNYNTFSTYGVHQSLAAYDITGTNTSSMGFMPVTFGNPNVTWESTETQNVGIDFVVKNKINFSFDLWNRSTIDMLYQLSIPQVMGAATAPFVNIGKMKNTGFDIELGYQNSTANGKFSYNISANISKYKNETYMTIF